MFAPGTVANRRPAPLMQQTANAADAAVVARPDAERGHVPRAFIQLRADRRSEMDEGAMIAALKDHVRARLGRHAYPQDVIFMAELPRNENGKVAKAALRAAPA